MAPGWDTQGSRDDPSGLASASPLCGTPVFRLHPAPAHSCLDSSVLSTLLPHCPQSVLLKAATRGHL